MIQWEQINISFVRCTDLIGDKWHFQLFSSLIWYGFMTHSVVSYTDMIGTNETFCWYMYWYDMDQWLIRLFVALVWCELMTLWLFLKILWRGQLTTSFVHFTDPFETNDNFDCSLHWYDGEYAVFVCSFH